MLSGDDAANLEKLASLNGHKHLILGNHDTEAKQLLYKGIFETMQYATVIKHGRWNFYLSHYPTNVGNFMREKHHKKFYCLCGHSHTQNKFIDFQNTKSYHVELDAHNNCPVLLDDIIKDIIKIHSDDRCFTCPYYLYCNEEATVCGLKKGKKQMAKVGDKIKILNMDGEPQYSGREGEITHIDDMGQLHGTWGGLAVIPGQDAYTVIEK